MHRNRWKLIRDLDVIRSMCSDPTALTSECEAAPVTATLPRQTPAAGAGWSKHPAQSDPGHHPDPLLTPAAGRRE